MRRKKLLLCRIKRSKKLKEMKSSIGDDGTVDEKGKKQTVISDEFEAVWLCALVRSEAAQVSTTERERERKCSSVERER
jgi:hypothetical protein